MLDQTTKAEELLLSWLRSSSRPISASELLERGRAARDISSIELREAVWSLVNKGEAVLTQDRRLQANR